MKHGYISLDSVSTGRKVVVKSIDGKGWVKRLYQLGITPGAVLEVIANNAHGPVIVRVGDTEVAIGRGIAKRIFVEVN
ncbi:MAG: FeoA family protein [Desulfurococcaceae archaeon]